LGNKNCVFWKKHQEEGMEKIGVVFVHGFTGGEKTWVNDSGQKFSDLLKQDQNINSHFDFFEFSYYTKLVDVFDSALIQRLLGLLPFHKYLGIKGKVKTNKPIRQLRDLLSTYLRVNLSEYDEVVIIAHSMGGLIAKDFILNHLKGDRPAPLGFVSVAVPHKGSLGALLLAPIKNLNAQEMAPLAEYPDVLNSEWIDKKDSLPKSIYLIASYDECVPEESSIPFKIKSSEKFTVPHDHISICKPIDSNDLTYKSVRDFFTKYCISKNQCKI